MFDSNSKSVSLNVLTLHKFFFNWTTNLFRWIFSQSVMSASSTLWVVIVTYCVGCNKNWQTLFKNGFMCVLCNVIYFLIFIKLCLSESFSMYSHDAHYICWSCFWNYRWLFWVILTLAMEDLFFIFHIKLSPSVLEYFFDYKHSFMNVINTFWLKMGVEF